MTLWEIVMRAGAWPLHQMLGNTTLHGASRSTDPQLSTLAIAGKDWKLGQS